MGRSCIEITVIPKCFKELYQFDCKQLVGMQPPLVCVHRCFVPASARVWNAHTIQSFASYYRNTPSVVTFNTKAPYAHTHSQCFTIGNWTHWEKWQSYRTFGLFLHFWSYREQNYLTVMIVIVHVTTGSILWQQEAGSSRWPTSDVTHSDDAYVHAVASETVHNRAYCD